MVVFLITLCLKDWLFETKGLEYTGYSMFGGRMCPTLAESCCTSIRTLLFKDINDSLMAVCCAHAWPQITFFATDFLQKRPKSVRHIMVKGIEGVCVVS